MALMPLPNTSIIPAGWSGRMIRAVGVGAMRGTCTIYAGHDGPAPFPLPLPDGWTPDGEPLTREPVRCRVQRVNQAGAALQADQRQDTREYQVTVDPTALPELVVTDQGPWVVVGPGHDDPHLDGLRLKVVDVYHGTELADQVLRCVHNQTQN